MTTVYLHSDTDLFYCQEDLDLAFDLPMAGFGLPYARYGSADAPVVVVQGGISAHCRVVDWWEALVGPGRAIDTDRYQVISLDYLGGSSAITVDSTRRRIAPIDQARVTRRLLERLGITSVHAYIGASYGGMVGLALGELCSSVGNPRRSDEAARVSLEALAIIGASASPHPQATAWRSLQRRVLSWGRSCGRESEAVSLARGIGLVSYRTREELGARFAVPADALPTSSRAPIEHYLEARGQAFADSFSLEAYETLSRAIDLHRVDPSQIDVLTTVVGVTSDQLVPIEDTRGLARALPRATSIEMDSRYGHDAFLKEPEQLGPIFRRVLSASRSKCAASLSNSEWEARHVG